MKMHKVSFFLIVTICVLLISKNIMAADANKPKSTPDENQKSLETKLVIGVVNLVKDKDGNITGVKVTAHRDLVYSVVLDEKGLELGKTMADRRARIEGQIEQKGNVEWVTVKSFGEVKAGAPPKTKAAPKPKPAKPVPKK